MKKTIKIAISIFLVLLVLVTIRIVVCSILWNNWDYKLDQFEKSTISADTKAGMTYAFYSSLKDNVSLEDRKKIIGVMINNIDDIRESKSIWLKQARLPVSYGVDGVLSRITKQDFGDLSKVYFNDKEELLKIAEKWKDWYKNEYPEWIKEQEQQEREKNENNKEKDD